MNRHEGRCQKDVADFVRHGPLHAIVRDRAGRQPCGVPGASVVVRLLKLIDDEDGDVGVRNRSPELVQLGELAAVHLPLAVLADDAEPHRLVRRQSERLTAREPRLDAILGIDLRGVRHQPVEGNVGERERTKMEVDPVGEPGVPLVELARVSRPTTPSGLRPGGGTER